jgi:hypothetical protein
MTLKPVSDAITLPPTKRRFGDCRFFRTQGAVGKQAPQIFRRLFVKGHCRAAGHKVSTSILKTSRAISATAPRSLSSKPLEVIAYVF